MSNAFKLLAAVGLALAAAGAGAQNYPTKPVRIIVPFPPVGAADLLTRTLGQKLTEAWGQTIIVDNRPGAGGNLGVEIAAKSAPDGYTAVMSAVTTNAIGMATYTKLGYSLERDLVPVVLAGNVPHILVAHPTLPAKNVKEVIAIGKARPGELAFASQGQGTLSHLEQEMLKQMGGFTALHVPYKGSAPGLSDLIPGNVQLFFDSIPSSLPHVKSGRLRALGTTGLKRAAAVPDVPTVAESGVPGFEVLNWQGIVVQRKTPPAIVARLHRDVVATMKASGMQESVAAQGLDAATGTPDQFGALIKSEIKRYTELVKTAGIRVD